MKRTLSIALALVLVLSLCGLFVTADETETEGPSSYLWLKADSTYTPYVNFQIDSSIFSNKTYNVRANVYFGDDCTGGGTVTENSIYVNYYSYADSTKYNDLDYLINYADFAKYSDETATIGGWAEYSIQFNPFEATYASGRASTEIAITEGYTDTVGLITVGMGFWNATGTVKVASILISEAEGGKVVWSKGFATGLDADDEEIINCALDEQYMDTNWGVVVPPAGSEGNLAVDATATYLPGYDTYTASLNDGVALPDKAYTGDWYGFYHNGESAGNNTTVETIEGVEYFVGTVVFDFGSAKTWDTVRANVWDGAGVSGIAGPALILVSYSSDGSDWTEAGDLLLGTPGEVYWAEKEFDVITAQYCRLQFCWASGGVFLFLNEIEIIEAGTIIIPDDSSEEDSQAASETESVATSAAEETSEPTAPPTGDTGFAALAIISVIVLAGAVILKRK
ncbi:MAG: hypothetical protein PHW77_01005 [Eubacteriales bacterium]|nr:hypothetical protein [Eubacteriales bacterium]